MIGIVMMIPSATQQQYDAVMQNLQLTADSGNWPEGIVSHNAGPSGSDWVVVDIWQNKEAFDKFFQERLGAAIKAGGLPQFEPKFFDVYLSHKA